MKSLAALANVRSTQKARSTMNRLSEEKRTRSDFQDKWIRGSNSFLERVDLRERRHVLQDSRFSLTVPSRVA